MAAGFGVYDTDPVPGCHVLRQMQKPAAKPRQHWICGVIQGRNRPERKVGRSGERPGAAVMNDGKTAAVGDRMRQVEGAECAHGVGGRSGDRSGSHARACPGTSFFSR